jgi:hypothetical protein
MATKSSIVVEGLKADVKLYKHWDGYPKAMIPWLQSFNKRFTSARGSDPEYKFAQLIRSSAFDCNEFDLDPSKSTGWGVVPKHNGMGEEFIYTLHNDGSVTYISP